VLPIKEEPTNDFITPPDDTASLVNQYILPCLHQSNASVLRNPNQLDPASNASAQLKCESAEESDHNSDMEEDTHHYECK
jgi:hypothetical protein